MLNRTNKKLALKAVRQLFARKSTELSANSASQPQIASSVIVW